MVFSSLLGIRQHDTQTIIFALPDVSSGNFWIVILTQHSNIFVLERISNEAKECPGPIYGSQIPLLTTWKMCIQFHHPSAWYKLGETTKKYQYNKGFTCKLCQSNNYPFMRIQGNFIWSGASTTRYSMQVQGEKTWLRSYGMVRLTIQDWLEHKPSRSRKETSLRNIDL